MFAAVGKCYSKCIETVLFGAMRCECVSLCAKVASGADVTYPLAALIISQGSIIISSTDFLLMHMMMLISSCRV